MWYKLNVSSKLEKVPGNIEGNFKSSSGVLKGKLSLLACNTCCKLNYPWTPLVIR